MSNDGDPNDKAPTALDIFDHKLMQICEEYANRRSMFVEILEALAPHASALDTMSARVRKIVGILNEIDNAEVDRIFEVLDAGVTMRANIIAILEAFEGRPWVMKFIVEFRDAIERPNRYPILLNGLLTNAVGALESHLASITAAYLRLVPQALDATSRDRGKEFSLADLKELDNIEAAIDLAISRRVDELLFGSFSDWRQFFLKNLKIDFKDLAIDWPRVNEVIQRRHVIVHNSGTASKRYVSNLEGDSGIKVGQSLEIDDQYIMDAIDQLFTFGYLIAQATWRKFIKDPSVGSKWSLYHESYKLLIAERWEATRRLWKFALEQPEDEGMASVYRVNIWVSTKALSGTQEIRADVESWDVTAMQDRFKLAKMCLLDDLDAAFPLLERLMSLGEISGEDALEWPLLSGVRADPKFRTLMPSIKKSLESDEDSLVVINEGSKVFHQEQCKRIKPGASSISEQLAISTGTSPCRICNKASDN